MLRWLGPRRGVEKPEGITDDPLAAIDNRQIYSISRSVYLPRVPLKTCEVGGTIVQGLVNPLYSEERRSQKCSKHPRTNPRSSRHCSTPVSAEKSSSSGYESANFENSKFRDGDAVCILEQNKNYVKSIHIACNNNNNNKKRGSSHLSGSSGTLTTIPEGRIDFTIPRPIWPKLGDLKKPLNANYDVLSDEAVMLYAYDNLIEEQSIRDTLIELLNNINETIEGNGVNPEETLKLINEKLKLSIEALKNSTEEEMRKLCINLSNSKNLNSVIRAFSNRSNSTSGNSSQSGNSPEFEREDLYRTTSSSSGFSDSAKHQDAVRRLPVFVHEDLASVPNGVRNAMIYGTLCRGFQQKSSAAQEKAVSRRDEEAAKPKRGLLLVAGEDAKPSVWEQYYGVNAALEAPEGARVGYVPKPTDVPIYPGGRPETDFTLDVHRSEILTKRLKADKKWRCRCRIVTSVLGVLFFVASVMAVSLVLTRGKRMFGSMV